MNKKSILLLVFFIVSVFIKAQITSISYPSGYLSEKRISEMIENSKKRGMKESEIQKESELLHISLKKQQDAIANGTFNNNQRTISPPPIVAAGCNNPGFETGTTAGWTFTQGTALGATLPCPTCVNAVAGGVFEITSVGGNSGANANAGNNTGGDASTTCDCSNSNTNDCTPEPYTGGLDRFGGFSVVAPPPLGGIHSCMLNNSNCGYLMQKASQIFAVNASDVSFTFQYAVVLQDGGHPISEAPYFFVNVTDVATGTVVPCTQFTASAEGATSGNLAGWTQSTVDPSVYWYPWTTVTLNLTSMIGRNANVSFTISDCSQGGHFGYAYIDASCNPLQITRLVALCPGQNAVLSGPPGMASYSWLPGGATTQNITTSTPGNYTLTTTSATGCPAPTLYYNLTTDPDPVASFTTSSPPCTGGVTFTDGSTIAAPDTITNWVWNFGDGTPSVNSTTDANQTHAYAAPGTYTVTLTDTTNNHCVASYSFVVTTGAGGPVPSFSSNSPATAPQCLTGNNVVFTNVSTATGGVVITGYVWDYGDGSPTVTSTTTTPNPPNHTYTAAGTYVVTLTVNVTGCSSTTTQTVVISPEPTASFTVPPVCVGNLSVFTSTITNGNTYSWTFGDGVGTSAVANPSYTYTSSVGSPYPVSLTVTATGGCSVTATGTAIVSPLPTASFTVVPVCEGTASLFNATASTPTVGGSFNWGFGGAGVGTNTTTSTPSFVYSASGTFPVTLTVSVGTCSATTTGNAVVNTFPVLGFTATNPCDGTGVNFTNTTANQAAISNWNWNLGDGSAAVTTATPAPYIYALANCYNVVLTATATTGCSGSFSATVNVHPNPFPDFNALEACLGTPSDFMDVSTITNPACLNDQITSWQWSFGDGGTANYTSATLPDTIKHAYAVCGSYNITLTVTTNNNCTNTVTLTGDTVFCIPVVTAPPNFSVCPGAATPVQTFTSVCANGGTPITVWFQSLANVDNTGAPPSFINPGGNNQVPSYNAIAQNMSCNLLRDSVYGVAVSGVGCVGNAVYYTANVYPTPYLEHMKTDSICANQIITIPSFTACPIGSVTSWTNSNTTIGLAANGTGNIGSFTGTNTTFALNSGLISAIPTANGCVGNDSSFTIVVKPLPTMTATGATVCPGDNVPSPTILINPVAGVNYTWVTTNNTNIGMPASGVGTPVAYTAPTNNTLTNQIGITTYILTLNGCAGTPATDTINIRPTPFVSPIPSASYCPNQQATIAPFVCLPAGGVPIFTWTGLGGVGNTQTGNVPTFTTVNNSASTIVTTFSVNATLNNCQGPDATFNITVFPNPIAKFTYTPHICEGNPTNFTDQSTIGGGLAINAWSWSIMNGGTMIPFSTSQNPQYTVTPAGWDLVELTVYSNSVPSCSATVTDSVHVNPDPAANFVGVNLKGCPNVNTAFTDLSTITTGAITTWNWNFGNGQLSNSQLPPPQVYTNNSATNIKYYSVSLTVTSDSGCTNTKSIPNYIQVYPVPIADFTWGPSTANLNDPSITFVNQAIGYAPYPIATSPPVYQYGQYGVQYNIGDIYSSATNIIDNSTSFSHSYNYFDPNDLLQTYNVTQWVINQYGCTDSVTKPVEIQPIVTFYIPNAFTPNGDGKNEGFKGIGEGIDTTTYNMWIFDRWGLMIYYTQDLNTTWNGCMHGDSGKPILQEDVYVWKVKFNDIFGTQHEYHGTVTLVK